jgi:hypothetical protein
MAEASVVVSTNSAVANALGLCNWIIQLTIPTKNIANPAATGSIPAEFPPTSRSAPYPQRLPAVVPRIKFEAERRLSSGSENSEYVPDASGGNKRNDSSA